MFEISDRVKKFERKMEFIKKKTHCSQSVPSFKKKGEANSSTVVTFSGYKKPGNFSVDNDMKGVECFRCHKQGHLNYAKNVPKLRRKTCKRRLK